MKLTTACVAALLDAGHYDAISEADFQLAVVALARELGWHVATFRAARVLRGGVEKYETPVGADGKGWPDLHLLRERTIYAELKSESGSLSADQYKWSVWINTAGQLWYCWSPSDWRDIKRILA